MLAGAQMAQAAVMNYNVTQTYNQIVYDGTLEIDTVFTGSFSYDTVSQSVSNLSGSLSQAMTEAMGMTSYVSLNNQLSSVSDGMGGLLVSTFAQNSTDVFAGGGFATGGTSTFGNENAYVTIYINTLDLTAALSYDQTLNLAYGDCTPGGLMGKTDPQTICMTGWVDESKDNLAGGTMKGTYPILQTVSAVPVPAAAWLFGSGLIGLVGVARRRKSGLK